MRYKKTGKEGSKSTASIPRVKKIQPSSHYQNKNKKNTTRSAFIESPTHHFVQLRLYCDTLVHHLSLLPF